MKGRKPGKLPNQKGLFNVVWLFKLFQTFSQFCNAVCHFEMEQLQQVLRMKDSPKVSLHIMQGCNINSRTTYVQARNTALISLLGYLLSLLMESSGKVAAWHDLSENLGLNMASHSILSISKKLPVEWCFYDTDPRSGLQKVTPFYSDWEGFFCSYISLALGWDNEWLRQTKYCTY